ncbi:hypothetical protein GOP47_0017216 [Adiantum capillus-veneris]|uniref:BHLH domain-containing protein n=1 Tax=Adiantum capillus-veneris TaxID=13818 RepID=A0A9D4UJ66_ADICA|nr:hypothetical protein GOP47_0017216 [Adiantum capillus-veneris]
MVLTGIQPPENMRQTASSDRSVTKSIPIPLCSRAAAATTSQCAIGGPYTTAHPQLLQNSAFSMSGLRNDNLFIASPQRSAGSFNMVHPMRKALMLSQLTGNQTPCTSSTKIHHDGHGVLLLCTSSSPAADAGMPSSTSSSSSSYILPSLNLLGDPPLHTCQALTSHSTDHLQSCELPMQPKELVIPFLASMSASGSNVTRISSAESMSTASSGRKLSERTRFSQLTPGLQLLGKQPVNFNTINPQREKIPGSSNIVSPHASCMPKDEYNERGICSEEEYGSLACCLQGGFWAHPEGTLCDCETLFKQGDHSMQIDDMIFDIPILTTPSSATDVKISHPEVADQSAKCHSDHCMTLSNFYSSLDLITRDEAEACVFGAKPSPPVQAGGYSPVDWSVSSTVIQADDHLFINPVNRELIQGVESTNPTTVISAEPRTWSSDGGRPSLVRSCSFTIMPPTNSFCRKEEQKPSLLTRTSSLGSKMGLVQSRKRSFSASELSSDYDDHTQPELLMELGKEPGDIRPHELQDQLMHELWPAASEKQLQAKVLQQKDYKLGGIDDDEIIMHGNCMLAEKGSSLLAGRACTEEAMCWKEDNLVCGINDDEILHNQHTLSKKGIYSNIASGINHTQTTHKQVGSNKSNHLQQMKAVKQGRRRHGTATDPQSIAARTRREKFSERIRMLQSLVPNGERLDTVSMLGQTLEYIRFLQHQVWELYHGSPLSTNSTCEKWKHFMETQDHHSSGYASSATSS